MRIRSSSKKNSSKRRSSYYKSNRANEQRSSRKTRQNKSRNLAIYKGGIGAHMGFPSCDDLTVFPMNEQNIANFRRHVVTYNDCVINALQLAGLVDTRTSNLLRIVVERSEGGLSIEQIERMFILLSGYNYEVKHIQTFDDFAYVIKNHLPPGSACFAGYTGHVFLITNQGGKFYYLDPQLNTICDLSQAECLNLITNRGSYFLLSQSREKLSIEQLAQAGFAL